MDVSQNHSRHPLNDCHVIKTLSFHEKMEFTEQMEVTGSPIKRHSAWLIVKMPFWNKKSVTNVKSKSPFSNLLSYTQLILPSANML